MKRNILALIATAAGLACGAASAQQTGFYGGVGLSRMDVNRTGESSYTPTAGNLVIGNQIDKILAVEFRLGGGLSSDSNNGLDVKLKDYVGGYLKVFAPVSHSASLYGLLGYTSGKLDVTTTTVLGSSTVRQNDSDVSFGIGGSFAINRLSFVTIELARLFKGTDYTVNALSAGINMRF